MAVTSNGVGAGIGIDTSKEDARRIGAPRELKASSTTRAAICGL
jgi:hypothetical protein